MPAQMLDLLIDRVTEYAIFSLDTQGRIASWNRGAERIKGYSADEIIGKPYEIFFGEEDRKARRPQQILAQARSTGHYQEEGWRVRKDGTRFWASTLLTALFDEGEFKGYAKITRDLTERLRSEEEARRAAADRAARVQAELDEREMRRSRDQLDLILRSITEGVIVQTPARRIVFANDAAARLCGFDSAASLVAASQQEIFRRFEVFREDGGPFPLNELPAPIALQGKASNAIVRFRVKQTGEERWSFVSAAPVSDATGNVELAVSVFREFTGRRRTEQAWQFLAEASAALASSLD